MTLVEVTLSLVLVTIILLAATLNMHQNTTSLTNYARRTAMEERGSSLLSMIKDELRYAQATPPSAFLTADLGAGTTNRAVVDTTLGFPDTGMLLLEPGTPSEERILFGDYDPPNSAFANLTRNQLCTNAAFHASGTQVLWAPSAEAIDDQINPPAAFFDGSSQEISGRVFYRGDGSGFSYRLPTDPAGGMEFLDNNGDIRWGSEVSGNPLADGWSCVYYEPVTVIAEAQRGADLNRDGDELDQFDLGRIRRRRWDSADPLVAAQDVALSGPMILQEQCNWGSDLDGDGFEDPMFLWDSATNRLRIRFFLLTTGEHEISVVRRIETGIFVSNGSWD